MVRVRQKSCESACSNWCASPIRGSNSQVGIVWKFKLMSAYEGPTGITHPQYKGLNYNVTCGWKSGEINHEPLDMIDYDDPVTCELYARENILGISGWEIFKSVAKREKKMLHMANQAKLRSYHYITKYKFWLCIPMIYDQANTLDEEITTISREIVPVWKSHS